MNKRKLFVIILIILIFIVFCLLYFLRIIPHKKYTNEDFGIEKYISLIDKDNDGVDDQSDIINNTREYINTKPKYKSKYYANGYPDDGYGVCTDVVVFSLRDAGYDLMELVNNHIKYNRELYNIDQIDKEIDFRRVVNLDVYLKNTAIVLTTDIRKIDEWQGGDIIVFKKHIGIVSDKRNKNGIPYIIHHANPYQIRYEEDILESRNDIIGHYRVS